MLPRQAIRELYRTACKVALQGLLDSCKKLSKDVKSCQTLSKAYLARVLWKVVEAWNEVEFHFNFTHRAASSQLKTQRVKESQNEKGVLGGSST